MSERQAEPRLSTEQFTCLARLAGLMIPSSEAFRMPGGDDPAILSNVESAIGRDEVALKDVLDLVISAERARPSALPTESFPELASRLRSRHPDGFAVVEAVIARAYYGDPRVLAALGLHPRPPFPAGYDIAQTDWSLVDPVRSRGKIWRSAGETDAPAPERS